MSPDFARSLSGRMVTRVIIINAELSEISFMQKLLHFSLVVLFILEVIFQDSKLENLTITIVRNFDI